MGKGVDPEAAKKVMIKAGLEPLEPYSGANSNWKCKCKRCGKIVTPKYASVNFGRKGCKYCAGIAVDPDDAEKFMLSKKLKPLEPYKGGHHKWKCRCMICGKNISLQYNHVRQGVSGCAYCSKNRVDKDDVVKRFSELGYKLNSKYVSAHKKVKLECINCGVVVEQTFAHVNFKEQKCYFCKSVRPRLNLKVVTKELSSIYELLEPIKPGEGKSRAICRVCKKEVVIARGQKAGLNGCPYCTGKKVDADDAVRAMRKFGFKPLEPFIASNRKWKSKHVKCGNIVYGSYKQISRKGTGCKYCAKTFVDPEDAKILMLDRGFEPLEPYKGAQARWKSRCVSCSKVSYPTYASTKDGHGCKFCAIQGMDYNKPAFIYLITHKEFDALKVGIGSQKFRIRQHTEQGWEVIQIWNFKTGFKASEIEEKVLKHLRADLKLINALSKELMPQKGHTETFSLDDVSVPYVKKLITGHSRIKTVPKEE